MADLECLKLDKYIVCTNYCNKAQRQKPVKNRFKDENIVLCYDFIT